MDSISLNDLGQSGFGSSSLNNCLIAAFWFGRGSSLHAWPHNCILSKPGLLSLCSPGDCGVRPRLGEQRQMGPGLQPPQLMGNVGDGVHCSLWHFKMILPESLLSPFRWFPSHLEQVLTLECGVWPQRNAVTLPANRLSCWMGGPWGELTW